MHKCKMTDFLILENGEVTRIVRASWKNKDTPVYKENENGETFARCLYYSRIAGYLVLFPDEMMKGSDVWKYPQGQTMEIDGWGESAKCNLWCEERILSEFEKENILSKYPAFKYVLQKWQSCNRENILKALQIWKEHKKVELLLASGLERIAFNKNFYKLSEEKRKEIIRFCVNSPETNDFSLCEIQTIIKNKLTLEEFDEWKTAKVRISNTLSFSLFRYLEQKNICDLAGFNLYKDYMKLLKKQGEHNTKQKYWRFPSDLRESHNKILLEIENEERLRKLEEEDIKHHKLKHFYSQAKKYSVFDSVINGYTIYIPKMIQDVRNQAKKLNQCLIRCDYIKQMAERKKLLVFIKKDEEPIATVEILPNKKIGQFYGNELDPKKIHPSEEIRNIFNQWLEKVEIGGKL